MAAAADLSLLAYGDQVAGCERCALAQTRTQVVFGTGSPTAELMFVGEAPGFHEDKQGFPFVGQAGKLLDRPTKLATPRVLPLPRIAMLV